ncbi:MAG: hypothetical protein K8F92_15830 [Hyphomicrobium sp.]|uniref:hypothetical protein n=1 Tax=Hyphomicrobium sp. TaxID=82 RepID=UPI0013248F65|nr:hypothetical protein [Hyphomicrobium sp.]KAB2940286.1 MAG: hypothetical protein F9K20_13630 [Hyphomicrobium sp.]MBZ0211101.1 hypothetical protein [Hyphomicrobium sp.]MCZ7593471.1 hypothetical protein [Hyphomicrobium sp.]
MPAVSGPNGKLSVEGGSFDDDGAGIALGSFALPLGHAFGLQADGALGTIDGETMGGGGLHLFTRDPSSHLFGVYGSYHTWDSVDIWRIAGEAELYLGRFTLDGLAGYESVDVPSTIGDLEVLTPDDKHFFAQSDLAYYITDDFKVYGGYRYLNETSFGSAGAEYLMRGHEVPLSLFARGDFGDEDYTSITGGLKVYLSGDPDKSLIDRHRRDDPDIYLPVFPKLVTRTAQRQPQCTLVGGGSYQVASPANGQCICPSGSALAGQPPVFGLGSYHCAV